MDSLAVIEVCKRLELLAGTETVREPLRWIIHQDWARNDHELLAAAFLEIADRLDETVGFTSEEDAGIHALMGAGRVALEEEPGMIDWLDEAIEALRPEPLPDFDAEADSSLLGFVGIVLIGFGGFAIWRGRQSTFGICLGGGIATLGLILLLCARFGKRSLVRFLAKIVTRI